MPTASDWFSFYVTGDAAEYLRQMGSESNFSWVNATSSTTHTKKPRGETLLGIKPGDDDTLISL